MSEEMTCYRCGTVFAASYYYKNLCAICRQTEALEENAFSNKMQRQMEQDNYLWEQGRRRIEEDQQAQERYRVQENQQKEQALQKKRDYIKGLLELESKIPTQYTFAHGFEYIETYLKQDNPLKLKLQINESGELTHTYVPPYESSRQNESFLQGLTARLSLLDEKTRLPFLKIGTL